MNREELSALIERYTKAHHLSQVDFAVGGQTARYLLGDCPKFEETIHLAFRRSFTATLPGEFEGHKFNCYRDHAEWASYSPSPFSSSFVITTRHRLDV